MSSVFRFVSGRGQHPEVNLEAANHTGPTDVAGVGEFLRVSTAVRDAKEIALLVLDYGAKAIALALIISLLLHGDVRFVQATWAAASAPLFMVLTYHFGGPVKEKPDDTRFWRVLVGLILLVVVTIPLAVAIILARLDGLPSTSFVYVTWLCVGPVLGVALHQLVAACTE